MRDESYASEAANARILGATRLHCSDYEGGGLTESYLARGDVNDSQCDRFNKSLRDGQQAERIPFRVED